MAKVHKTRSFDASADEIWALIGDFHGIHKWVQGVEPSEKIGEDRSTLSVKDAGDGKSVVDWEGNFDPAEGTAEEAAVQIVEMVYEGGLAGLQKTLAS